MRSSKRALTTTDITRLEVFSDPQFTPDGTAFTFTSTTINEEKEYESHLFFQKLNEKEANPWTFNASKNNQLRFSPDGKRAVFQSTRSGLSQIWLIHMDGGEPKQLTTFHRGATNPVWAPDGKHIFFSAYLALNDDIHHQKEPTKEEKKEEQKTKQQKPMIVNRLDYKSDARGLHDHTRKQIIMMNVDEGTLKQLTNNGADHEFQDISPDGNAILFTATLNDDADYELTNDLYCLHIQTEEKKKLTNGEGIYFKASFSPDGAKIASFGHEFAYKGASLTELHVFDYETAKRRWLSKDWDIQLGDSMIGDTRLGESESGPVWNEDSTCIFFIATSEGATELYQVSLEGKRQVLYKNDNHVFGFAYDGSTKSFLLGISNPTTPCDFYLLKEDETLIPLTNSNKALLDEVEFQEPEVLSVKTEDDWIVQGWLLRPYGFTEEKKYPTILEIHGGPHAMYGQTFFFEMQLLAAKGYVVLYTNPRGSHGYGQKFVNACREDYGSGDYRDLMAAVDYAVKKYSFIDDQRLGVTGGSYGGFMTNWIIGHTNRFKVAVTQRSISNWLSFYGVSDIGYFFTEWEHGVNLLDDPAKLWALSPLKYAEKIETPLLILHGELDYRCPIEQGEQLFITLKHLKKEVEFIRFPKANHELSRSGKPYMRIERLNHICRWFEKYLA